jgi:hypothetical protein
MLDGADYRRRLPFHEAAARIGPLRFRSVAVACKVIYGEVRVCIRRMSGETRMRVGGGSERTEASRRMNAVYVNVWGLTPRLQGT